jgi:hypothetical protein
MGSIGKEGATVSVEVIDDRVDRAIREEFKGDRNAFIVALKKNGLTLENWRDIELTKIIIQAVTYSKVGKIPYGKLRDEAEEEWLQSLRLKAKIERYLP